MKNNLVKSISKISRNELMLDLIQALELIFKDTKKEINSFQEQIFLDLFNLETIEKWERFMELKRDDSFSLKDRRDRILYHLLSRDIFSPHRLREESSKLTGFDVDVFEHFKEYWFELIFSDKLPNQSKIRNFREFIELNKPAHLGYNFLFSQKIPFDLNIFMGVAVVKEMVVNCDFEIAQQVVANSNWDMFTGVSSFKTIEINIETGGI